jgi:uncharacterized phage infection (PIP) family protein YhgE
MVKLLKIKSDFYGTPISQMDKDYLIMIYIALSFVVFLSFRIKNEKNTFYIFYGYLSQINLLIIFQMVFSSNIISKNENLNMVVVGTTIVIYILFSLKPLFDKKVEKVEQKVEEKVEEKLKKE